MISPAQMEKGAALRPPSRRLHTWVLAVTALVAGLALGRFLFLRASPEPRTASRTPRTSEDLVKGLEQAVVRRPSDARSWQALGVGYLRRAGETGDPTFYGLAERALDRADELAPSDPATILGRAGLALSRHDFDAALRFGNEALAANPFSPEALGAIVDAEIELGRYEQAAAHLQQMLDLRPALPALARVSHLRELHGDVAGALQAMKQAEEAGSGSALDLASVVSLRGDLHFNQGDLDRAEEAYGRALRLSPGLLTAEMGRARVLAARGDRSGAISALQGVVDRFPRFDAVTLLGDLQALAGLEIEASRTYELARTIAKLHEAAGASVDLEMALFEADRGTDPGLAVELARRAHSARPNIYASDALAWALYRAGDLNSGQHYVEEALRLGTADGLLRFHAAEIFAGTGDFERARLELGRAFQINPWFSFLHQAEALALAERLGMPIAAAWSSR
jgi:tetratricopeptide (TPR) repeat protein